MCRKAIYVSSFLVLFSCRKPVDFNVDKQPNPDIIWSKCYGVEGLVYDEGKSVCQTADGGTIMAGTTTNLNFYAGQSTLPSQNFYVIKTDSEGGVEWQYTYGGGGYDIGESISIAPDGNFFVAGFTVSSQGDVSGYHPAIGSPTDGWVIKIDKNGHLLWQKCIGGFGFDYFHSVKALPDGSCILTGNTLSTDGDLTGFKKGLWVVKLNTDGDIQWQQTYGSSTRSEVGSCISISNDNSYIITGVAYNGGDDIKNFHGNNDVWVVKINSIGVIVWEKALGGSGMDVGNSIIAIHEGGYLLTGYTRSRDGDVQGLHTDRRVDFEDMWVVKLDDLGNIVWQRTMGGINRDQGNEVIETSDQNFIAVGYTTDFFGQDDYSRNGRRGIGADVYAVKFSSSGGVIWQKIFGGTLVDQGKGLIETKDKNFIFLASSTSTDVDIHDNHGWGDFWLVKFKD